MQHCVELSRAGTQPSLPLLGTFCLGTLGLQMRVRNWCRISVAVRECPAAVPGWRRTCCSYAVLSCSRRKRRMPAPAPLLRLSAPSWSLC